MAKRDAVSKSGRNLIYEEIVPSSDWTEDATSYCLIIDLIGFKKLEVKVQVDIDGHLLVRGERQVNENKIIHFKQTFNIPENSNNDKISGKFEDGVLYITIPKLVEEREEPENGTAKIVEEENEHKEPNKDESFREDNAKQGNISGLNREDEKMDDKDEFHEANTENRWDEVGLLETVKEKLKNNKGLVVTAILAFSLGILMSHTYQSNGD